MHVEMKDLPYSFWSTNVMAIDILFHLVAFIFQCCFIRSLVYVLEAIFYGVKRGDRFNIYMAMEFSCNVWVVWDYLSIVEIDVAKSRYHDGKSAAIIRSCISWVPIISSQCILLERLWIPFSTMAVLHTGC